MTVKSLGIRASDKRHACKSYLVLYEKRKRPRRAALLFSSRPPGGDTARRGPYLYPEAVAAGGTKKRKTVADAGHKSLKEIKLPPRRRSCRAGDRKPPVPLMGAHWSRSCDALLAGTDTSGRQGLHAGDGDDSLDGLDRQEDIAQFPYVEFTGRDSITCPTCQGTGRIPSGQLNELVALIPYSDQRLQPHRTKLYVVLSVVVCLLVSSLVAFFMFPRPVVVEDDGIRSATVLFDRNNSKVLINMTSSLNFTNSNFFTVLVDSVSCQVLYMKTVIGTQQLGNVINIQPLSQRQVNFTVGVEISGSLSYVYAFCTMASIKVHNIVVFMQTTVKTSYMVRSAQNTLEAYRYIDCGSNSTVHKPPAVAWSDPHSRLQVRLVQ